MNDIYEHFLVKSDYSFNIDYDLIQDLKGNCKNYIIMDPSKNTIQVFLYFYLDCN